MTKKRLARLTFGGAFLVAMSVPAIAFAEEAAEEAAASSSWQEASFKAMAAGLAMGMSALGAGYAQAKIGAAGAGTLAERPEVAMYVVILQALPEIIVLLGFVAAIMLSGV